LAVFHNEEKFYLYFVSLMKSNLIAIEWNEIALKINFANKVVVVKFSGYFKSEKL
jgi:hypothetical protein